MWTFLFYFYIFFSFFLSFIRLDFLLLFYFVVFPYCNGSTVPFYYFKNELRESKRFCCKLGWKEKKYFFFPFLFIHSVQRFFVIVCFVWLFVAVRWMNIFSFDRQKSAFLFTSKQKILFCSDGLFFFFIFFFLQRGCYNNSQSVMLLCESNSNLSSIKIIISKLYRCLSIYSWFTSIIIDRNGQKLVIFVLFSLFLPLLFCIGRFSWIWFFGMQKSTWSNLWYADCVLSKNTNESKSLSLNSSQWWPFVV